MSELQKMFFSENLESIQKKYFDDIKLYQEVMQNYMKIHIPKYILNQETKELKILPIDNKEYLLAEEQVKKITQSYERKYKDLFSKSINT